MNSIKSKFIVFNEYRSSLLEGSIFRLFRYRYSCCYGPFSLYLTIMLIYFGPSGITGYQKEEY